LLHEITQWRQDNLSDDGEGLTLEVVIDHGPAGFLQRAVDGPHGLEVHRTPEPVLPGEFLQLLGGLGQGLFVRRQELLDLAGFSRDRLLGPVQDQLHRFQEHDCLREPLGLSQGLFHASVDHIHGRFAYTLALSRICG